MMKVAGCAHPASEMMIQLDRAEGRAIARLVNLDVLAEAAVRWMVHHPRGRQGAGAGMVRELFERSGGETAMVGNRQTSTLKAGANVDQGRMSSRPRVPLRQGRCDAGSS